MLLLWLLDIEMEQPQGQSRLVLTTPLSLTSHPYFSAYAHACAKVGTFARACAYAEKYGWLARLHPTHLGELETNQGGNVNCTTLSYTAYSPAPSAEVVLYTS